jgi:plastocyanin
MTGLFRFVQSGLVIALASGIAVCGGCASAPTSVQGQPAPAATVEMDFHSFDPPSVTIKAGQAVLWRNNGMLVWHTVTCDPNLAQNQVDVAMPDGAKPFDSGKVSPGEAFEHVFDVPGTYKYFCQPHESHGMLGVVIVQPATP